MSWALADFRLTNYRQIERWWELVMSAYLLVSLHTNALHQSQSQPSSQCEDLPQAIALKLALLPFWNQAMGWKQALNNLRRVIQPLVILNLLEPWLNLFPIPRLSAGERVFGGTDESPILAACLVTTRRQVSTFPPPRVTEER